jgi:galactokinase
MTDERLEPERLRERLRRLDPAAADAPDDAIEVIRAPGRVNLIGEHTDYNDGFVMPAAIGLEIRLAVLPTEERWVRITLDDTGEADAFHLDSIGPAKRAWIDYVAGTAWSLQLAGLPTRGFRALLVSSLPQGAGLSSSAALEMAAALALLGPGNDVPAPDRAKLGRRAENEYVDVRGGVMDQFSSAAGVAEHAVLLDCRSLDYRLVSLPIPEIRLVVCHSGSPHKLEASQYNDRVDDCARAVAAIREIDPSVRALRDVDETLLARARDRMDEVAYRRASHIVAEDGRVLEAERALAAGDLDEVGRLFAASHASLRDLYEVSSPELDALVEIAGTVPGVIGSRLTGAGFGGSTINLVRANSVEHLREAVERDYPRRTGLRPMVLEVDAVDGAGWVA